jgi:UDP-N-acetyl-D-mannosaminouronate:lipid I N-acetyl-D-mannosaminouronosyltransferase
LRSLSQSGISYPDGIGAVWALKRKGANAAVRVPGCELWLDIVAKVEGVKSVFLIGGTEDVIQMTRSRLKDDFPNLRILGARNGYLDDKHLDEIATLFQNENPDIVFVAQGSPRQEETMQKLMNHHEALYMGLGGSFDVYTGAVRRAPLFWRNNGMEWLYRLASQPSRLKRQLVLIPFACNLIIGKYE